MLNLSDVQIKSVGKGRRNKIVVNNLTEQQLYPPTDKHPSQNELYPPTMKECEKWIEDNCVFPGDKVFPISLLEHLTSKDSGEEFEGLEVVRNDLVYQGNVHADFVLVFKQENEHYAFPWHDYCGTTCMGEWMSRDPKRLEGEDKGNYLCRKVSPQLKTTVQKEIVFKRRTRK